MKAPGSAPEGQPSPIVDTIKRILAEFHSAILGYGEDYKVYADKIKRWNPMKFLSGFTAIADPMKCGFQVLNHGDCWVNNFMVKYDEENNPIDVLLIDFQISFWGSPAVELLYFFISSLNDDIKVDYFDELVEYYHNELVNNLKMLNYEKPVPTLEELNVDIVEKSHYSSTCLMFVLFVCKMSSKKEVTIDQIMKGGEGSEELLKIIYTNDCYTKACKKWLPFFNSRGFLDSML